MVTNGSAARARSASRKGSGSILCRSASFMSFRNPDSAPWSSCARSSAVVKYHTVPPTTNRNRAVMALECDSRGVPAGTSEIPRNSRRIVGFGARGITGLGARRPFCVPPSTPTRRSKFTATCRSRYGLFIGRAHARSIGCWIARPPRVDRRFFPEKRPARCRTIPEAVLKLDKAQVRHQQLATLRYHAAVSACQAVVPR